MSQLVRNIAGKLLQEQDFKTYRDKLNDIEYRQQMAETFYQERICPTVNHAFDHVPQSKGLREKLEHDNEYGQHDIIPTLTRLSRTGRLK